MNIVASSSGWNAASFIVPNIELTGLIALAATLLVFRTFRERYLLTWIVGWLTYLLSSSTASATLQPPDLLAISQAEFILAVCLFAASIFIYTRAQKMVLPLLLVLAVLVSFAISRVLWWPHSFATRVALEISYRVIAITAAVQLMRFRRERWEVGPWLLCFGLLLAHLDWAPVNRYFPSSSGRGIEFLLGFSILLVVFEDSQMRTRRLGVLNAVTTSITREQQHGPMLLTALEELKRLMSAKAAWFRVLEGDRLVLVEHIGLSDEFIKNQDGINVDDSLKAILAGSAPMIVEAGDAPDEVRPYLKRARFNHVLIMPVVGKKSTIGVLSLGSHHRVSYAPEDLEFLANSAHQLGLAVENLRLMDEILRSHRQWTNTFDSIQDFVLLHDSEFRIMKANGALLQRLVQAPADVVGKGCEEVLPHFESQWKDCPYCGEPDEGFHEGIDPCFGGFSMVSSSSYVEQGARQKGTIHVVRDVSDRRVAEEKYRQLFEQMQEGVFVATPEGKLLDCNDAFVRMFGHTSREELMAVNIDLQLHTSPEQRHAFHREVELHNYVRNFEVTLRRKDGTLLTAVESSFATRDANGKIDRYQGFLLDITEKKRAEDEIRRRNRELNALNAMAVIATQSFDLDEILNLTLRQVISLLGAQNGSIYLCESDNTIFRRRAGWGKPVVDRGNAAEISFAGGFGELVTRSRTEVITTDYLPHLPQAVADFVRGDGSSSWIWVLLWGKDSPIGIMGICSGQAREYTNNDENLLVAIGRQLATTIEKVRLYEETCRAYEDLRLTQEQLLQSEKMSAVGQLIAGVAHELNNPLTAILGYAQLLESEGLSERASDFVAKLFKQAQRTHRVVQNLLSFARQRKPHKQKIDIHKVLDETLALRDYDTRVNNIRVERDIETKLPAVTGDSHQLEQVFLNIINNAVDAMLESGHDNSLKVRAYTLENYVHVEIQDSGGGIKEPKRIFEPFYTTKSVGKGTGLGLSICYGIIKEHGGDISAKNSQDGGAIIEVRLPSAGKAVAPDHATPLPRREVVIEGTILLVDDEEAVIELERDVLSGAGAQVVTLMNWEDVKLRLISQRFDAVMMNGKMPGGWTVRQAHEWISKNCPGLESHVLFTFSSVAEPEERSFLKENNIPYLVKPFEVGDLIAQARRLLQKTRAATAG
ncbi:MAG: GAF domain-containing protein [Terriglobales bacterium]